MNHWLHPDAEKELGDAAEYYLLQANLQVAEAFLAEYEQIRYHIKELTKVVNQNERPC